MPRQVVLKDSLQTLESYPRVRPSEGYALAQPTTAQCRVRSPSETETAFAACTLDTLEGTVSTAGEEGDQTLTVQIEADVVRLRRYLLELSTGEQLWVRAQDGVAATLTAATATLKLDAVLTGADMEDVYVTLIDGAGVSVTFEFDEGGGVTAGRTAVAVNPLDDALTVMNALLFAIDASVLGMTGSVTLVSGSYELALTQTTGGSVGNTTTLSNVIDSATSDFTVTFTGGGGAAKTVRLMSPLPCDVPTSSTLYGMRVSRALTLLETVVEGHAMIDWRVLDGSGATIAEWSEQFEIARRVPRWELDEDELARRMPEIYAARDANDVTLQETIDASLEEELLPRLRAKRDSYGKPIREENIVSTWALVPAHVAAVRLYLANNDTTKTKEMRDEARAEVLQKLNLAFEDADAWYDAPQTETPSVNDERGRFGVFRYTR